MARTRYPGPIVQSYTSIKVTKDLLEGLAAILSEFSGPLILFSGRYFCDSLADVLASPPNERLPLRMIGGDSKDRNGTSERSQINIDISCCEFRVYSYKDLDADLEKMGRIDHLINCSKWVEGAAFLALKNGPITKMYLGATMLGIFILGLQTSYLTDLKTAGVSRESVRALGWMVVPSLVFITGGATLYFVRRNWFLKHRAAMPINLIYLNNSDSYWTPPKTLSWKIILTAVGSVGAVWGFVYSYILQPLMR